MGFTNHESRITNHVVGPPGLFMFPLLLPHLWAHPLPSWERAGVRGRLQGNPSSMRPVERARRTEVGSKISRIAYPPLPNPLPRGERERIGERKSRGNINPAVPLKVLEGEETDNEERCVTSLQSKLNSIGSVLECRAAIRYVSDGINVPTTGEMCSVS
jgi:hypothetical protein